MNTTGTTNTNTKKKENPQKLTTLEVFVENARKSDSREIRKQGDAIHNFLEGKLSYSEMRKIAG